MSSTSPSSSGRSLSFAFALVGFAYVIAHVAAGAIAGAMQGAFHPLVIVAAADLGATIVVFAFSRAFDNSSFYDAYWSVAPVSIAWWLALQPGDALTARQWLVLALISLYGARLTFNWARGWTGLGHEDWRYVDLRKSTGKAYWVVSFFGLHFFPTVCVFLGVLPLHAVLSKAPWGDAVGVGIEARAGFSWLDVVAAIVTLSAIVIETVADEQLRNFRTSKTGEICDVGLWSVSRHPNYFGEISFWFGLWLFGVAAGAPWWSVSGVVVMIALFNFASIPLAEKRSLARRPHFAEHQRRVSKLIPWFRSAPRA